MWAYSRGQRVFFGNFLLLVFGAYPISCSEKGSSTVTPNFKFCSLTAKSLPTIVRHAVRKKTVPCDFAEYRSHDLPLTRFSRSPTKPRGWPVVDLQGESPSLTNMTTTAPGRTGFCEHFSKKAYGSKGQDEGGKPV